MLSHPSDESARDASGSPESYADVLPFPITIHAIRRARRAAEERPPFPAPVHRTRRQADWEDRAPWPTLRVFGDNPADPLGQAPDPEPA